MQVLEDDTISIIACADSYHTVQCNGIPNGAFYFMQVPRLWQGITRANRLLTPTPSREECLQGVIDAIGE